MNLHEFQAKQWFKNYDLPVAASVVVNRPQEAAAAVREIGGDRWVVKAQVHAGGRGKAGGVQLVDSAEQAQAFAQRWLGQRLVTAQTDTLGQPVNHILIEPCMAIADELYLGAVLDRAKRRIVFMASSEGGVEIEQVAAQNPEKILSIVVDPLVGAQPFQARQIASRMRLNAQQTRDFVHIYGQLAKLFVDKDLALLEINPLIITQEGRLHCLDAKINIDDTALYRHADIRDMYDPQQENARERRAAEWSLNYVALNGDIGCMVNGAGLAMATMDSIKSSGGAPANFLDVGGGATRERVAEAFKIILADDQVKVVLVNIFGGIVRCDLIADGIIGAIAEVDVKIPVVVRLEGNNATLGAEKLTDSGLNITTARGLQEAADKAVTLVAA